MFFPSYSINLCIIFEKKNTNFFTCALFGKTPAGSHSFKGKGNIAQFITFTFTIRSQLENTLIISSGTKLQAVSKLCEEYKLVNLIDKQEPITNQLPSCLCDLVNKVKVIVRLHEVTTS